MVTRDYLPSFETILITNIYYPYEPILDRFRIVFLSIKNKKERIFFRFFNHTKINFPYFKETYITIFEIQIQ